MPLRVFIVIKLNDRVAMAVNGQLLSEYAEDRVKIKKRDTRIREKTNSSFGTPISSISWL